MVTLFNSETFTTDMLSNPTVLAKRVIDAMESADSNPIAINDPNNGFVMQLGVAVGLASKFSEKIDYANNYFYPRRARTAEQLYAHLSEFDFTSVMSNPATLPFVFDMSKDWIIANSVYFDINYNKLQIPATSTITMGGIRYSMYYPIDIFVNRNTQAVSAVYNTDVNSSLHTLTSNMLLDVREYTKDSINWFRIQFNMYQFNRDITTYTVASQQGFNKTLNFENSFYAAKVFYQRNDLSWTELEYSLSQKYYDYQVPTALLTILSDINQIKISIPQIYFDTGQVTQTIRIELYTTLGKVNYTLSLSDVQTRTANFDTTSTPFAAPLIQMPSYKLFPTTINVVGGSNAQSFTDIRNAVITQSLHERVAITPNELLAAGRKSGFTLTRTIDDLTQRMYTASNILTDENGMVIPTFCGSILIADEALTGNPSTIIDFTDGYYTIQPTTLFTVNSENTVATPLSDGQVSVLASMTKADRVDALNKHLYVRQPFHITLKTDKKSPVASVYNLLSPSVDSLVFVEENVHSAPQMSVTAITVDHLAAGTGGYRMRFSVTRSNNIVQADIGNFNLIMTVATKTGEFAYHPASYVGLDATGNDVFEITLVTNYHITEDENIQVMLYDNTDVLKAMEVSLTQSFNLITSFNTGFDLTIAKNSVLQGLLPVNLTDLQTVMSQQSISLTLGKNLSDQIYCGVSTAWGNDVYDVTDETIYFKTEVPVFQQNEDGIIVTRNNVTTSAIEVVQIYGTGDTPSTTMNITYNTVGVANDLGDPGVLTFADVTGILVGMSLSGLNIPVGTTVEAIDGLEVMLSQALMDIVPEATPIVFANQRVAVRTSVVQSAVGNVLEFTSTLGILPGMSAFGFGIDAGATVVSVDDTTHVTLSVATTEAVALNTLITFINNTAYGVVKIAQGSVLKDASGAAIVIKDAQNQYRIPTILFDGRLFESEDPDDLFIVTKLSARLQAYADNVATLDSELIEVSDVYYKPARTLGTAVFGVGNGVTKSLPLEKSFDITVYVDEAIYNTETTTDAMENTIISILNAAVQGETISLSDIANTITDTLGENIIGTEINSMNGDTTMRLIAVEDKDVTSCVESILVLNADQTVSRKPNVTISFVTRPDTVTGVVTNNL